MAKKMKKWVVTLEKEVHTIWSVEVKVSATSDDEAEEAALKKVSEGNVPDEEWSCIDEEIEEITAACCDGGSCFSAVAMDMGSTSGDKRSSRWLSPLT